MLIYFDVCCAECDTIGQTLYRKTRVLHILNVVKQRGFSFRIRVKIILYFTCKYNKIAETVFTKGKCKAAIGAVKNDRTQAHLVPALVDNMFYNIRGNVTEYSQ